MINDVAINVGAINDLSSDSIPVFLSTPPSIAPVIVTELGSESLAPVLAPANNLYQSPSSHNSVVIDITTPQTPKHGSY